jgi:hypothetical protein
MHGVHGGCCEQVASCMAHGGLAGRMLCGMLQRDAVFIGCQVAIHIMASELAKLRYSQQPVEATATVGRTS